MPTRRISRAFNKQRRGSETLSKQLTTTSTNSSLPQPAYRPINTGSNRGTLPRNNHSLPTNCHVPLAKRTDSCLHTQPFMGRTSEVLSRTLAATTGDWRQRSTD
ncbi:unnamed protein product [Ixodes pacificus]